MIATFWDLLASRAASDGDRDAIVQGETRLTFAEWHARARAFGQWFLAEGGRPGDRVLLWMDSSPDMAVAMLGLWSAGGIFALMDPKAKATHLAHAMQTVEPCMLVCDSNDAVPSIDGSTRVVEYAGIDWSHIAAREGRVALPTDPASIVFTSGSTGRPKGVTQSHRNLLRACESVSGYLSLASHDRILCSVPWSFDYGYGQLLSTLMSGATQVLPTALNPFAICRAIAEQRPTVLAGIPSLFTYLLRGVSPFRETDVSSIHTVTNTGGRIPGPVLDELRHIFEGRRIFLNYGLTETYRTAYLDPALTAERPTSIGHGIPGTEVIVVREDDSLAEPGEVGQIVHRGDFVCMGYWNDPEASARALRPDPLAIPGCPNPAPVLYTGDYGWKDADGYLYFSCRRDSQLKSMGVRVSPLEIEELLHASGLVSDVAVVGKPHEMLGDEIWAFVVPLDGEGTHLAKQLTRYARDTMSPYMVPRRVEMRGALPKTTTGKTDYPALKSEVAATE